MYHVFIKYYIFEYEFFLCVYGFSMFQVVGDDFSAIKNIDLKDARPKGRPRGTVLLRSVAGVPIEKIKPPEVTKTKGKKGAKDAASAEDVKRINEKRIRSVLMNFLIRNNDLVNIKRLVFKIDLDYLKKILNDDDNNLPDCFTQLDIECVKDYFEKNAFEYLKTIAKNKLKLLKGEKISWTCYTCKQGIKAFSVCCEWCLGWYHAKEKSESPCSPGYDAAKDRGGKKKMVLPNLFVS